ncbi:hypothetical protein B0T20DRAFT_492126 [Sordaria brevicollis]|uniref:Uncharacterized protein n=1 Tax=Sordaria brevicollis TaxID=83679 RepID=A0AAE0UER5_SORBR|nr:hypothetical protein B0T20DRAFT_492126 [Sordaria brevicollis]
MHFTSDWDSVPHGLEFLSPDDVDRTEMHLLFGGIRTWPWDEEYPEHYNIICTNMVPFQPCERPDNWLEVPKSILDDSSYNLALFESYDGPEKPGFAAPLDVVNLGNKALGLRPEQTRRIIEKQGSFADHFFSESTSDSSVELAFRWTTMPGSYLMFMGRFTPKLLVREKSSRGMDKKITRMVGFVAHRSIFPISPDEGEWNERSVFAPELRKALNKREGELEQNPLKVFAVVLELCVAHLDEKIEELEAKVDGISEEDLAEKAREMGPRVSGMKKACADLIAICDASRHVATRWSQKLKDTKTQRCAEELKKDVQRVMGWVELRLEKLKDLDRVL